MSVHNRILELAPDLARTLAQRGAWYFDRKVRSHTAFSTSGLKLQGRAQNRALLRHQIACHVGEGHERLVLTNGCQWL